MYSLYERYVKTILRIKRVNACKTIAPGYEMQINYFYHKNLQQYLVLFVPFPRVGKKDFFCFLHKKKIHQNTLLGKMIDFWMHLKMSGNFQGNNVFLLNWKPQKFALSIILDHPLQFIVWCNCYRCVGSLYPLQTHGFHRQHFSKLPYFSLIPKQFNDRINRPFPSSLVPLFQNESKFETFHMKMSSACSFIFMQIKVTFKGMVLHLDSLWNRGKRELGNGLYKCR